MHAVVEPLRRYALRRTDAAAADDVVADALLVMWRRLDDVPRGGELPWCYAVTRRCLANVERSQRRHRSLIGRIARLDPPENVTRTPPDAPDPGLENALRRLRSEDREVLRLWAWEDLRPNEIAAVLDITPNAASIRLHRAKTRLGAELDGSAEPAEVAPLRRGKEHGRAGQMQVDGTEDRDTADRDTEDRGQEGSP